MFAEKGERIWQFLWGGGVFCARRRQAALF
jgi:hypothetical protein